jgi:hypothetical protein
MHRIFLILISQIISSVSSGQGEIGIKANGGLSKAVLIGDFGNVNSNASFVFSGQGGLYYNSHIGKKSLLGVELLISRIAGYEEMKFVLNDGSGNPPLFGTVNLDYRISYLVLPVYYGHKIGKLTITLGVQPGLAMSERIHQESQDVFLFPFGVRAKRLDPFDWGIRTGLLYPLSKSLSLEASYYNGMDSSPDSRPGDSWAWKVQQITLGLRWMGKGVIQTTAIK